MEHSLPHRHGNMSTGSDIKLNCLLESIRDKTHHKSIFWRYSEIAEVVELVVDAVDPKIRVVSRYNKQLRGPVETTWHYLDGLIGLIPGDMRISKRRFGIDPRVRVMFDDLQGMLKLFNESPALTEFFQSHQQAEDSYVFLSMEKKEHNFLGMELNGDMIRRDVLRTAVTFSNHHILTPAATEQSAREGIKCCAFEGLLKKAQQIIFQSHAKRKKLEEAKQRITREIRHLKSELGGEAGGSLNASASLERLNHELHNVERDLIAARMETESPNRHLQVIIDVLNEPQRYVSIKRNALNVNSMGVKLSTEPSDHGHLIEYAEMEIEQSLKRVAMVASFPKRDLFAY